MTLKYRVYTKHILVKLYDGKTLLSTFKLGV